MIFVSPGVYWNEVDLSAYIPNLSTTIAAIVGTSTKGPTNVLTLVTNVGQQTQLFGVPNPDHPATYCASQFLRNGSQMYFIRVNGDSAATATVSLNGATAAANVTGNKRGPFVIAAAALPSVTGTDAGATVATISSTNQNLLLSINGSAPIAIALATGSTVSKATIAGEINTLITAYGGSCVATSNHIVISTTLSPDSQDADSIIQILATTNNAYTALGFTVGSYAGVNSNTTLQVTPVVSGTPGSVLDITLTTGTRTVDQVISDLNTALIGGSSPVRAINFNNFVQLYQTTADQTDGFILNVNRTSASVLGALATLGLPENVEFDGRGVSPPAETMTISALSPGTWGDELSVQITNGSQPNTFKLLVFDSTTGSPILKEKYDNLVGTHDSENLQAGLLYFLTAINGSGAVPISKYIVVTDDVTNTGFPVNGTYVLAGGDDGMETVSDGTFIGTTDGQTNTGLQLLTPEQVDINLVLCPGIHSAPVINAMIALCETRADCMCLVDPPLGIGVQQVIDWHNGAGGYSDHTGFNSSYAALYWPWLEIFDPANQRFIWCPPSGNVASLYAYSDFVAEVWYAPAGFTRGVVQNVTRCEQTCDHGDRETMYGNGNAVNPIVNFNADGIVIYGQRTLQRSPTALDRVNVRRLMLYLRKVISTGVRVLEFQPDDPTLWRQFSAIVNPYLTSVKRLRGITDFLVVCDETTNTPDRINNNEMYAKIFIDPTRAAEKIFIDAIITAEGVAFSEIVL